MEASTLCLSWPSLSSLPQSLPNTSLGVELDKCYEIKLPQRRFQCSWKVGEPFLLSWKVSSKVPLLSGKLSWVLPMDLFSFCSCCLLTELSCLVSHELLKVPSSILPSLMHTQFWAHPTQEMFTEKKCRKTPLTAFNVYLPKTFLFSFLPPFIHSFQNRHDKKHTILCSVFDFFCCRLLWFQIHFPDCDIISHVSKNNKNNGNNTYCCVSCCVPDMVPRALI